MKLLILIIIIAILMTLGIFMGFTNVHFYPRPDKNKTVVACVGDSITYGCGIFGCFFRSYPAKLQKLLGRDYQVINFGMNDRSVQRHSDKPYVNCRPYTLSKACEPDIVVIFLGTNDSKQANWSSTELFFKDYLELIQEYQHLPSHPQIIALAPSASWIPPKMLGIFNDSIPENMPVIGDCVKKIAEFYQLPFIDLYAKTYQHPELYCPDKLHFNPKGTQMAAELVAAEILKEK